MFRINVIEFDKQADDVVKDVQNVICRFEQTVDTLDLPALIAVINKRPRKERKKKEQ